MWQFVHLLPLSAGLATAGPSVASLGSSYASSFPLYKSYGRLLADLLAEHAGEAATYDEFAVPGSNVTAIAFSQAERLGGKQYDAVVITAGGNDLNYVNCLLFPGQSYCGETIERSQYITRYTEGLDATVKNLGNPIKVPIYVVTYTQAIGASTLCASDEVDCTLTQPEVKTAKGIYDKLIDWTFDALDAWRQEDGNDAYTLKVIPMHKYSANAHDVGSCEPWINGAIFRLLQGDGAAWHPNAAGLSFMAQAIYNDMKGLELPSY